MQSVTKHPTTAGILVTIITLALGGLAIYRATFGAPVWFFLPVLIWLATVGSPTTVGVLLTASVWGRLPSLCGFWGFVVCAACVGLAFQLAGFHLLRRCRRSTQETQA